MDNVDAYKTKILSKSVSVYVILKGNKLVDDIKFSKTIYSKQKTV